MNQILKFTCPKCGHKLYEIGEIWTVGNFWTSLFKVYNRRFTYITCKKCKFTEMYKTPMKEISSLLN